MSLNPFGRAIFTNATQISSRHPPDILPTSFRDPSDPFRDPSPGPNHTPFSVVLRAYRHFAGRCPCVQIGLSIWNPMPEPLPKVLCHSHYRRCFLEVQHVCSSSNLAAALSSVSDVMTVKCGDKNQLFSELCVMDISR